ncbi:EAL and HDOD domain-containing protein [Pseudogulbenkiania ferrooxidans]|uniref:Putative signal transduction protein n=1 Tax=Pseudogulbenkiania ferrooxidans 2002 TaxID=279714 RepID=B9Z0Z5_9NEIS|nr:HDOD domain-containing protein [Pseudogulbenkiania ferrooxidans]EEG09751.1 putative signal transduction protein [Pseudogulbenkiania ferrooxidans 2002]
MLKQLFGGLLGKDKQSAPGIEPGPASTSPTAPPARILDGAHAPAPLHHVQTLGFVSHHPVQDKDQRVVAYEFIVKGSQDSTKTAAHKRAFDRLLLTTLRNMNVFRLLAYRRAFIHLSLASLDDLPSPDLPADSCIFILGMRQGDALDEALMSRLDALRQAGLRFAVEPAGVGSQPAALALYQRMDYLVLDFAAPNARMLFPLLEKLPQRFPHVRWLGRNINSAEELDLCLHSPGSQHFVLFHGSYLNVAQPRNTSKNEGANQGRVLEVMRLLRANAPIEEIEAQFKLDSLLLFKLMRYINSPVNGLNRKVQTIEEGIMLLGRGNLFKWLSLMLFTAESDSGAALTLMEKSLIRARFMEELGLAHGNKLEAEHLFLTGMFSLLGTLLNTTLAEALAPLDLPMMIADALLRGKGLFAEPLQLVLACEQDDNEAIARLGESQRVSLEQVTGIYLDAVVWAQEVLKESDAQNNVEGV